MIRRLLIATSSASGPILGASADQRNAITANLQAREWEVWHWFEDLWLVTFDLDVSPPLAPLREELKALTGLKFLMIMDIPEGVTFTGYGNPKGWPWMTSNWGRPRD